MLYYLDRKDRRSLTPLRGTTLKALGWQEKDLENLVASHIASFVRESQLFLIAQSTAFREMPDIMALDREGRLHIFELKRWESSQENLLQVLRYGQKFGRYDYRDLNDIFARHYRKHTQLTAGEKAPELQVAHAQYFELVTPLELPRFNHDQRFVVMTNGLDHATRQAIAYWGTKNLKVHPLAYRVYETRGKDLLIEIDAYGNEIDDAQDAPVTDESGLIVVNTNSTYMPDAWKDMLRKGRAAAFYERKSSIDGIAPHSPIALYHTGVGFIAVGKTLGNPATADVEAGDGQERHVRCAFDYVVDPIQEPEKAVKAWELNEHLDASHRFRQTVYTLPVEALGFIRKRLGENGAQKPKGA